jgi:hypothetical protein
MRTADVLYPQIVCGVTVVRVYEGGGSLRLNSNPPAVVCDRAEEVYCSGIELKPGDVLYLDNCEISTYPPHPTHIEHRVKNEQTFTMKSGLFCFICGIVSMIAAYVAIS